MFRGVPCQGQPPQESSCLQDASIAQAENTCPAANISSIVRPEQYMDESEEVQCGEEEVSPVGNVRGCRRDSGLEAVFKAQLYAVDNATVFPRTRVGKISAGLRNKRPHDSAIGSSSKRTHYVQGVGPMVTVNVHTNRYEAAVMALFADNNPGARAPS